MKDGKAFVGFQEGAINFPPTFKYDVARNSRLKQTSSKRGSSPHTPQAGTLIDESQEQLAHPEDREDDAVSLVSSISQASSYGDEQVDVATRVATLDDNVSPDTKIKHKTRERWRSLISATGLQSHRLQRRSAGKNPPDTSRKSFEEIQQPNRPKVLTSPPRHSLDGVRSPQPPTLTINSTKTSLSGEEQSAGKGVYDSSHKQRVPSW